MPGQHSAFLTSRPDQLLVTDGGLETTLIFRDRLALPDFASFTLLASEAGRAALRGYYDPYAAAAQRNGVPTLFNTPTWRANASWGANLGYTPDQLATLNRQAAAFMHGIRADWETPKNPMLINGAIGPRYDGYVFDPDTAMTEAAAAAFHAPQIAALAAGGVDVVTAWTMTYPAEAAGIALAARAANISCIVSFTVDTDGKLPNGATLAGAIAETDAATANTPLLYAVNCAHITHIHRALEPGGAALARLGCVRPNPSPLSHAQLNTATSLDPGDPVTFAANLAALRTQHPNLRILGGCCGSTHTHADHIARACRAA